MIDVHSHVLWGLDDGAETRDDSVAMLLMAAECGTTDIVASPHSDLTYSYDVRLVDERIADLASEIKRPRIHRGCDFHMSFENVQHALESPRTFTIGGLNYLLVEFADTIIPPSTEEIFRQFFARGIVPVITHPERNPVLQTSIDRLHNWIDMGCLIQVTAQSLTDRFGRAAQKAAWEFLRRGMVHVIASDAHDTEHRPPRLDLAHEILTREIGTEAANLLLIDNPGAILAGRQVLMAAAPAPGRSKSWFQFWK